MNIKNKKYYIIILLILITFIVFIPIINFEFVAWDDNLHIYENPYMDSFSSSNILHFWKKPNDFALTFTLWSILAKYSKYPTVTSESQIKFSPYLFHITNLIIHLLNVLLIFLILKILVKNNWAACGGALLFAIHPVQVESVAWITGLKDVLSGFFSLLSVWQYLLYAKIKSSSLSLNNIDNTGKSIKQKFKINKKYLHYTFSLFAYLMALSSKSTTVILPIVIWILDYWMLKRTLKQSIIAAVFWLIPAIPISIMAKLGQPNTIIDYITPVFLRPFIMIDTLLFYLYKLFLPIKLSVDYGRSPDLVLKQGYIYFTWIILLGLAIVIWRNRKSQSWLLASVGIFTACILPVSGLIPFGFQNISTVADRYLYFTILGPAIALSFFILKYRGKKAVTFCILLFFTLIGIRSVSQIKYWKDTNILFSHALEITPKSWASHNNLGNDFKRIGNLDQAAFHYSRALDFKPHYDNAQNNLGLILERKGKVNEAISNYIEVIKTHPDYSKAHYNLGIAYERINQIEKAIFEYNEAIRIEPSFPEPYNNLGIIYARQKNYNKAIELFLKVLEIKPDFISVHYNLGTIYLGLGEYKKAIYHYSAALKIQPSYANAHNNLGVTYEQINDIPAAISHYNSALQINPDHKPAQDNLNRLLKIQQAR